MPGHDVRPDGPPLVIGRYYLCWQGWLRLKVVYVTGMAELEGGVLVRESDLRRCRSMAGADPSPEQGKVGP